MLVVVVGFLVCANSERLSWLFCLEFLIVFHVERPFLDIWGSGTSQHHKTKQEKEVAFGVVLSMIYGPF